MDFLVFFHCEVQDGLSGMALSSLGCQGREFHCWSPGAGLWRGGIAAHSQLWGQFGLIWRRRYPKVSSLKPLPGEQTREESGALAGICPAQKPLKLVSIPHVPVGFAAELTAAARGSCRSSSLTQKDES